MKRSVFRAALLASVAATALAASPVRAQEQIDSEAQGEAATVETLVVTAEKRAANIQDTPIAISAYGSESIERQQLGAVEALQFATPSLSVGQSAGYSFLAIRGIGADVVGTAGEPSVATYEDGVYTGALFTQAVPSFDLERIEVLRGPQGTLYGRNAVGGVINYITKAPTFVPTGNLSATYGSYDRVMIDAGVSGPLWGDRIAGRLTAHFEDREGYRRNRLLNEDEDALEQFNLRGSVLIVPTAGVEVTLRADAGTQETSSPFQLITITSSDPFFSQQTPLGLYSQPASVLANIPGLLSPEDLAMLGSGSIADHFGLIQGGPDAPDPNETTDFLNPMPTRRKLESNGRSVTVDLEVLGLDVKSITSYRENRYGMSHNSSGFAALGILLSPTDHHSQQFTQEINVGGEAIDGRLTWLAGAFYFRDDAHLRISAYLPGRGDPILAGISFADPDGPYALNLSQPYLRDLFKAAPPALSTVTISGADPRTGEWLIEGVSVPSTAFVGYDTQQESISKAAFGQVTYEVIEGTRLTGGLRYTRDEKDVLRSLHSNLSLFGAAAWCDRRPDKETWKATTGLIGLDHDIGSNVLTYAKVSTGYKAGGFNNGECAGHFDPEKLTAYELGVKSILASGQLLANVALFAYDYKQIQFTTFINNQVSIKNAGSAELVGVELQYQIRPATVPGLQVDGSVSHIRSEYGHGFFETVVGTVPPPGIDIGGNQLIRSPEWKANFGIQYGWDLSAGGEIIARLDTAFSDEVHNDIFNGTAPGQSAVTQPAYWLTNASIVWVSQDARKELQLFVNNLGDELYANNRVAFSPATSALAVAGQFSAPRTAGVRLSLKLGR